MRISGSLTRTLAFVCAAAVLGGCSLPRSGPNTEEIGTGAGTIEHGFEIIEATTDIANLTAIDERSGFSFKFVKARAEPYYLIERGDTLVITIWENAALDKERICLTFGRPCMASSRGKVICCSTSTGASPGASVRIMTCTLVTSGKASMGRTFHA